MNLDEYRQLSDLLLGGSGSAVTDDPYADFVMRQTGYAGNPMLPVTQDPYERQYQDTAGYGLLARAIADSEAVSPTPQPNSNSVDTMALISNVLKDDRSQLGRKQWELARHMSLPEYRYSDGSVDANTVPTRSPQESSGATTPAPVHESKTTYKNPLLNIGTSQAVIPSTGYTEHNNAGGAKISVNPVDIRGDNGGSTWAAMNALYTDPKKPPSLGELLAFSAIMNGKRELGSLGDVHKTMQQADINNAYASQAAIANQVQELMKQGKSMEEARYEALTKYMLDNGMDRGAVSVTMPEYAKAADVRAGRELDTTTAAGGNYKSKGSFGYTPLGIRSLDVNGDTFSVDINGNNVGNTPLDYLAGTVYGAIKGDGKGTSTSNDRYVDNIKAATESEIKAAKAEADLAKAMYDARIKQLEAERKAAKELGVSTQGAVTYDFGR